MKTTLNSKESLLQLLHDYQPESQEQEHYRELIIRFIQDHPDYLSRNNFYGHITPSAWVIDPAGEKALLTLHRKIGLWLQLGGHTDDNPDLLAVALREVQEESGLTNLKLVIPGIFDVDVHRIPAIGQEPSHYHFDIRFFLQLQEHQPLVISDESLDLAWHTADEIHRLDTDASVYRLCKKWQEHSNIQDIPG
ncbi:MAG: NUDIX hydrolase [Gammaproteobacteria bacterium]|nr:NUDIX hydrolase [Gammaproteobacteria bacterium]